MPARGETGRFIDPMGIRYADVVKLGEPVRYAAPLDASLPVLIESVKAQGLEVPANRVARPTVSASHHV